MATPNSFPSSPGASPGVEYRVPYGDADTIFRVDAALNCAMEVIESNATTTPALPDLRASVVAALAAPLPPGTPSLRALVERAMQRATAMGRRMPRAVLAVTDLTRASPDNILAPILLEEINAAGLPPEAITILIALGLHRPLTEAEINEKVGAEVAARYRIVNHQANNPAEIVPLGYAADHLPLSVNRMVIEADLVVATGVVEPHQYAGFSGGRKTVGIGLAGAQTIAGTHSLRYLDNPNVGLGQIDGNPFHLAIDTLASRAGLSFIANVVNNAAGQPAVVAAGEPHPTFTYLANEARRIYRPKMSATAQEILAGGGFDIVIAGCGAPKDVNLYQASRAATYVALNQRPVVRQGGVIIVPARALEGIGTGAGEQRFAQIMQGAGEPAEVLRLAAQSESRGQSLGGGGQRAVALAKTLQRCRIVFAGTANPDAVRSIGCVPQLDIPNALAWAAQTVRAGLPEAERARKLSVAIMPHALLTLPG